MSGALFGSLADGMLGFIQQNMQNWYNSPQNQMQMMIDSGINPNLAAAGIAGSPSNNTSFNRPTDIAGGILGDYQAETERLAYQSQKDVNESIANRNNAEAENIRTNTGITRDSSAALVAKNFADASVAVATYHLTDAEYNKLKPYADNADEWYKIDFDKLDNEAKIAKQKLDNLKEEYNNIKKEYDRMVSEIGKNNADARLKRAQAAIDEQEYIVRESLGGTDDLSTAYILARVEGRDDDAYVIRDGVKKINEAEAEGQAEGGAGHKGVAGETIDAIRLLAGMHKNKTLLSAVRDVIDWADDVGYNFEENLRGFFSGVFGQGKRSHMSYEQWESQSKKDLANWRTQCQNDFRSGKLSNEGWKRVNKLYNELAKTINRETYNNVGGKLHFQDLSTNPIH